jgi:hypothetical protein
MPWQMKLAQQVTRYGAQSIIGRTLTAREVRDIDIMEMIVRLHKSRADSLDFAEWAKENPKGKLALEAAYVEYTKWQKE